jgi:hypothetical protein
VHSLRQDEPFPTEPVSPAGAVPSTRDQATNTVESAW